MTETRNSKSETAERVDKGSALSVQPASNVPCHSEGLLTTAEACERKLKNVERQREEGKEDFLDIYPLHPSPLRFAAHTVNFDKDSYSLAS